MVYLALGVLTVTLSVTLFRYRYLTNLQDFLPWREQGSSTKAVTDSSNVGKQEDDGQGRDDIPSFAFHDGEQETTQTAPAKEQEQAAGATSGPTTRATATSEKATMLPPARKTLNAKRTTEQQAVVTMQPPLRPTQTAAMFKAPPKPSTALRPPPSAASSLRAPPSNSLKPITSSLAASTSTLAPSARPSRKVILEPGHSPLDWAALTANPPTATFLRGADVPPNLIRVPPSAVRYHSGRKGKDAWGVYQGKVYNLSPYMKFHPGGVEQLMRGAGNEKEGERLFNEIHPWVSWENMLGECLIGILVSENEAKGVGAGQVNELEEMD